MRISVKALGVALACLPAFPQAQPIRVASWNLGWHVSAAEVPNWTDRCARSYRKNPSTKRWDLATGDVSGTTIGWLIKEPRASLEGVDLAKMPPCGVYQESGNGIPVTPTSYANRTRQISHLIQKVIKPDVIAFQEVSGSAAIREALGPTADQYHICSFDDKFKVQRLAFAWRKRFGDAAEACKVVESVSLPQEPAIQQVRPALTVGLRLEGKLIRFMTVHLKSSCVSSLEKARLDDESQEACVLLQKQIRPLETAVEGLSSGADHVVVLGDFNRNLWHEANEVLGSEAMRSDGERQLSRPLASGVQSRNLFREVFDGDPGGAMSLLPLSCTQEANNQTLCTESKMRVLTREEKAALAAPIALGCRYPIGLDHFVVSDSLQAKITLAEKLPIGQLGGSKLPVQGRPEPFLAVSDHCPIVFTFIP